ncbi:unnamed protein product [Closterium sp. Yama58-4]|nr:unnamed protein product [Closterium sp. Yama58-4]
MGKGKAVLALLAIIAVIAASPLQASQATAAEVGTWMKIGGRSLTFNALRCAAIPASGGSRSVQVSWQQENKTSCTAIQFFRSSSCTGKTVDTLVQGKQRSKPLGKAVKSARCIIAASNPTVSASNTTASASNTTASASNTTASASNTTASASNTTASASNTTASASNTTASASNTTASASNTTVSASNTTAPASNTTASASNTTASASNTTASASNTTASASNTTASASNTTASASNTTASASNTTASASNTTASASNTTASASNTTASSEYPDAESSNDKWIEISSITVVGSDWRCKEVYSMYGLTLQQFTAMNPGIDCSSLLPHGRKLAVKELLPACSAFYYVQPNDTCSSVAQFLNITEESLQQVNPDVSCPSSLPAFRSLCVERDPTMARPTCVNRTLVSTGEDFQQVAASNGITMLELCRLNSWISFRASSSNAVLRICVGASYPGASV